MKQLENKIAIVTGAASGIGKGIALTFASEGAKVALLDFNKSGIDLLAKEINDSGGFAIALEADVTDDEKVRMAVDKVIEQYGMINILVNNAGIGRNATLLENDVVEKLVEVFDVVVKGMFIVTEKVVKKVIENSWDFTIINITSIHSEVPMEHGAQYAIAKSALKAATKSLALELAKYGIRVNAIAPGAIRNTGMNLHIDDDNELQNAIGYNIPLKRFGKPEEIAHGAVFLATNNYVTGHELVIGGGLR